MSSEVMEAPELLESYRPLLFSIAYQMTGSASEAEDLVQETSQYAKIASGLLNTGSPNHRPVAAIGRAGSFHHLAKK